MSDSGHITLADGTVIDMRTGRPVRNRTALPGFVEVPTNSEAVEEVTRVRRRLSDLPEVGNLNAVAAVAAYYMFGLDDYEIAHALGCSEKQVGNIRMLDAFGDIVTAMQQNVVQQSADATRSIFEQHSPAAARTMIDMMNSEDEKVAVVAAKDVLDRAGHRPTDIVEHRHRVEGGLRIEYVKRGSDDALLPLINVTPTENTDGEMEDDDGNRR